MERVVQVRVIGSNPGDAQGTPGPGPVGVQARPTWTVRLALLTFLVIVALPLLILFGVAIAAAAIVFGGLTLLAGARRRIKAAVPGHDGRVNVRVRR
jgi:hypothetical protein